MMMLKVEVEVWLRISKNFTLFSHDLYKVHIFVELIYAMKL